MKAGLSKVIEQLQDAGGGLTDGQLLARFVAARDEASFAALLRRHGPMVLGVCRRVLGDFHDAEDAFQATFLILARRASSVVKRESVGCYLYAVAYRAALEAAAANARRRSRERQVQDMPHPIAVPAEVLDWKPLLDHEVDRLSESYRGAVVLCDLEGRTRKEAGRILGVPESTVSSRLARGRALLAKRLAARGVTLSAAALAAALAAEVAWGPGPAGVVCWTARVAALVAAGQLAAVPTSAAVLMKGVMKAMLVKKLRLAVGAVMVAAALGAVGFVCGPGDEARAQPGAGNGSRAKEADPLTPQVGKATADVETLRKEVEDLRATVRVLLKENRALEKELEEFRTRPGAGGRPDSLPKGGRSDADPKPQPPKPVDQRTEEEKKRTPDGGTRPETGGNGANASADRYGDLRPAKDPRQGDLSTATKEIEAALKALREAREPEMQQRAAQELDRAMKKVQELLNPEAATGQRK